MKKLLLSMVLAMAAFVVPQTNAADLDQCASCHVLDGSKAGARNDHLQQRKGPDLSYAGLKFNKPWLVEWLQAPTIIRPAGIYYGRFAMTDESGQDKVNSDNLPKHPSFDAAEAEALASALMELKANPGGIEDDAYSGKGRGRFGKLAFTKLRGCKGCHLESPEVGGLSGPELYTAGKRLQPDYIASFTAHPQAIEPRTWMPTLNMSGKDVQNITAFILSLSQGDE
ncbi:MAG: c-type cytochrome [Sphingomonadales bacterium]|jgi:mono/diheme cytochrome c family protein